MTGEWRGGRRRYLGLLALGGVGAALGVGCGPAAARATPTATTTAGRATALLPVGTASSASAAPTAAAPSAATEIWQVGKTDGDGVYLRSSIKPEKKVKVWPDGTPMVVVGSDTTVDDQAWKNVRDPAGNVGWVPARYLVASQKPSAVNGTQPTTSAAAASPASSSAAPAKSNAADLDAATNGNIPLAAEQLRALGAADARSRAQRTEPAVVLRDMARYLGTIVRIEGFVGQIQTAPAGSLAAQLLGLGVVQLVVGCRDGTVVEVLQFGPSGDPHIGDLVAVCGLPVGQSTSESRLGGSTTRLVVVGKLIEKLPR